jgi:ankyrin repeat protein
MKLAKKLRGLNGLAEWNHYDRGCLRFFERIVPMTMHETRIGLIETEVKNPALLAQRLKEGLDPNCRIQKSHVLPLDVAVVYGCVESCQILLDAGADPNGVNGNQATALCRVAASVANGWSDSERGQRIVDLLLQFGAKPDGVEASKLSAVPIYEAALFGNVWLMRKLIKAGAKLDPALKFTDHALQPKSIVEAILDSGNDAGVLCALQLGVDDSGFVKNGRSFFQQCVMRGLNDTVRYYIEQRGEDVFQRTADGKTLLAIASKADTRAILRSFKTDMAVSAGLATKGGRKPNGEEGSIEVVASKRCGGMSPL